jgi:hypothetical protein
MAMNESEKTAKSGVCDGIIENSIPTWLADARKRTTKHGGPQPLKRRDFLKRVGAAGIAAVSGRAKSGEFETKPVPLAACVAAAEKAGSVVFEEDSASVSAAGTLVYVTIDGKVTDVKTPFLLGTRI